MAPSTTESGVRVKPLTSPLIAADAILRLHAPSIDGVGLDGAEDDVLDHKTDDDDGQETGEHRRDVQAVLVLGDEPAETTGAGRHAEHQFGGDQRAPGERPTDLETSQEARERGRDQEYPDVVET